MVLKRVHGATTDLREESLKTKEISMEELGRKGKEDGEESEVFIESRYFVTSLFSGQSLPPRPYPCVVSHRSRPKDSETTDVTV